MNKVRYKYDCINCKYSWCCGISCSCIYKNIPNPPKKIQFEHAQAIQKLNPLLTLEQIIENTF